MLAPGQALCQHDDLQDTRYFMELICSVPAEPLPMQILALAKCWQSKSGEQLQTCSCRLLWLQGSQAVDLWGSCSPLQMCHAIAGCSNDLCSIGQSPSATLRLLGIPIAACAIPNQCQQAPAAGIDTPEQHELALLPDVLSGPLNGNKQTDLLRLVYYVVEGRSNHA